MALYKVKIDFEVVVEADSMFAAVAYADTAYKSNPRIPSKGYALLLSRASQIPKDWRDKRPANGSLSSVGKTCRELLTKKP